MFAKRDVYEPLTTTRRIGTHRSRISRWWHRSLRYSICQRFERCQDIGSTPHRDAILAAWARLPFALPALAPANERLVTLLTLASRL